MIANVTDDAEAITDILARTRRIAVLGIKTEAQPDAPAFYVPKFLVEGGYDVVPVPVYYPEVTTILGRPVERRLASVSPRVDMVNVFRRSEDIARHVEDILAASPKSVWFQQGIRNDEVANRLAAAGIQVVQDRCIMVEVRLRRTLRQREVARP